MWDEVPNQEEAVHQPGILAKTALRATSAGLGVIDAILSALQRLRSRIAPPVADEEESFKKGKRSHPGADEPPAIAESLPLRQSLLHRFLVVVMCVLIGGVVGMLVSYSGFSKQITSQEKRIDRMQDEIMQYRQDAARDLRDKYKLQKEIAGYRNSLKEISQEAEDLNRQIAELNTRLSATRQAGRPAARSTSSSSPRPMPTQPSPPPKTGTCVTSGANATADLLDCIGKFNSP
ncbi:MAG: hypothetical protein M0Q22_04570 [Sulfuritalea sp.]|jgi:cell division protein FtsB|nr:hypothetical protein [Sulfuritalea sp.]